MTENHSSPHRVIVAGGGVAGLEALSAIRALASGRVALTLVEPQQTFGLKALSVRLPFAAPGSPGFPLAEVCAALDVEHVTDTIAEVRADDHEVLLGGGGRLAYDSLVIALGAAGSPPYEHARTFTGPEDAEALHGIVQDLEGGYLSRIAFVVPPGTTWPLPLYELALQTAERAADLQLDTTISLITPEERPLQVLGRAAADDVAATLADAGVELHTGMTATAVERGVITAAPGAVRFEADRVITLPRLTGRAVAGLPADPDGFIPVDEEGAVAGVPDVYAAGDGTAFPIKQGGLAAQQADVAATTIARRAGADATPASFRPVLNAQLLTGTGSRFVHRELAGGGDGPRSVERSGVPRHPLRKVSAGYLTPLLERLSSSTPSSAR